MAFDHYIRRVMSGSERGVAAAALRAALAAAEPVYSAAVRARNRSFDRDPAKARRLPRPVVSVGNLTAGGTGKTPVVRWLASRLRDDGRHVAVLSRGYKAAPGSLGDEQRMLQEMLNGRATSAEARVEIRATPTASRPAWPRSRTGRTWTCSCWTTGSSTAGWCGTWTSFS